MSTGVLVALVGLGVVLGLILVASLRPAGFEIRRSRSIAVDPPILDGLIGDFREWVRWSPWEKLDPAMHKTFSDPSSGVGASYAWAGNRKAGAGNMSLLAHEPNSRFEIQLNFVKPMKQTNLTILQLEPEAQGTRVTWSMTGTNNLMGKLFGLIADLDKLVGRDFEAGLANLEAVGLKISGSALGENEADLQEHIDNQDDPVSSDGEHQRD